MRKEGTKVKKSQGGGERGEGFLQQEHDGFLPHSPEMQMPSHSSEQCTEKTKEACP